MPRSVRTQPSGQDHHRSPHIHKVKHPADVFLIKANASMRHGPSNGPTMGGAVETHVGAAANLHHLLAIPATGIGAVLIKGDPAGAKRVSTPRGNQSSGAWMSPNGIHRLEQHLMLSERRLPTLRADSSRDTQTKLAVLQKDQLTAGAMQHQLLGGSRTHSSWQQGKCLRITQPGGERWNGIR